MSTVEDRRRAQEPGRGRHADAPQEVPPRGWKDILWRTYQEINQDRVTLIAAGVTYYLLLALFPALAAFVSLYGLFTDPSTVNQHLALLSSVVPAGGMQIIEEQLTRLAAQGGSTLGWALVISLGIALWSASAGVKALFEAMNVAYDETETRSFIQLNVTALLFTLAGIIAIIAMIGVVVVIPLVLGFLGLGEGVEWLVQLAGYAVLIVILFVGIAALYRFGPSRQQARWRWITPGAVLSVAVILAASALFSWYAANFANFDKTYGSLGALIGFLIWMWLSITIVIVGAELNAEIEHQTAKDSTVGHDEPLGEREATVADTVGKAADEGGDATEDRPNRGRQWQEGHAVARQHYRPPRRRASLGTIAFAIPAALVLAFLGRRREAGKVPQRG